MNIAEEFLKNRKTIGFPGGSELVLHSENNQTYHCVRVKGHNEIKISNAHSIRHLKNIRMPGILVRAAHHNQEASSINTSIISGKSRISQLTAISHECFSPLLLPSRFQVEDPFAVYSLLISSKVDFLISSPPRISRKSFIDLAKGYGVEIGPGPSPQILNCSTITVKYIEEKPAEEWKALYKDFDQGKGSLWKNYQVGKASEIQDSDETLDFVFASHVFEHLHNPLGHLRYWAKKLRVGGLALLVIPQQSGTKDYSQRFTGLKTLMEEEIDGSFDLTIQDYRAWGKGKSPEYISKLIEQKASIHVHTYDYDSIISIVEELLIQGVFRDYILDYLPCTKDFLLALKK